MASARAIWSYKSWQHQCFICYCRERRYCLFEDLNDFGYVIQVKEAAPDLLHRALSRAPAGVVGTGDYQPTDRRFRLSRRMLEVCLELGFPVFVLERSPLVLQDPDLLQVVHEKAVTVVVFSIISTPDSLGYEWVREMECLAPPVEKRLAVME